MYTIYIGNVLKLIWKYIIIALCDKGIFVLLKWLQK